jgi:hypothetical protein
MFTPNRHEMPISRDLAAISRESQRPTCESVKLQILYAAPARPVNGMMVYADGTLWNPGAGVGFYGYQAGAWVKF